MTESEIKARITELQKTLDAHGIANDAPAATRAIIEHCGSCGQVGTVPGGWAILQCPEVCDPAVCGEKHEKHQPHGTTEPLVHAVFDEEGNKTEVPFAPEVK